MAQEPRDRGLVIHVPHASTFVPPELREQFPIDADTLAAEVYASADLWTDRLAAEAWPDATRVEAPVSRVVVDVERYADDEHEPMARVGRGMIYSHDCNGLRIRRQLSAAEEAYLKERYYDPHWARVRQLAAGRVVIDLHSYPTEPWAVELDPDSARAQIVLGSDPRLTPASWVGALSDHFGRAGYSLGLNRPYAGVIDAGATAAVMLEIRRDVLGSGPGSSEWEALAEVLGAAPRPS